MKLEEVKLKLNDYVGKNVIIKYNLGRNKFEEYEAKIKELYNNVFLVELNNNDNILIKSFSYTDIITKTIKINY
ncbi:MAG: Veg family protein [Clostridium sp.]|nr:Veg family protein [Clostridium sp.]MCM1444548.1 Veg family protein [Candidatus Amulumruptor caecigallinarius]